MVRVLARWGYTVTHRDPIVLQCETAFDPRELELSRDKAGVERVLEYAMRKQSHQLAEALFKTGYIEWIRWDDVQYMRSYLRARIAFFPVVSGK